MSKKLMLFGFFTFILQSSFAAQTIDLTHEFDKDTIVWPTEKGFEKKTVYYGTKPEGFFYSAFKFCTPEHGGTHIDAPIHFSEHGLTVDEIKPKNLMGQAIVVDVHEKVKLQKDYAISLEDIKAFEKAHRPIHKGDIVFFRTDWSKHWHDKKTYLGTDVFGDTKNLHFPGISEEAAKYLVQVKVKGIGIDSASMDPGQSKNFKVHRIILAANLYGIENLKNLDQLDPIHNFIIAAPMKIKGGSGGPTRVFAIIHHHKEDNR